MIHQVFYEEELDVPLVLFNEVLDHVLRIDRIFRQPQVTILLVITLIDFEALGQHRNMSIKYFFFVRCLNLSLYCNCGEIIKLNTNINERYCFHTMLRLRVVHGAHCLSLGMAAYATDLNQIHCNSLPESIVRIKPSDPICVPPPS